MIQEIITYLILIATFGFVFYKFIMFVIKLIKGKQINACSSCSKGSCSGCPFASGMSFEQYNNSVKQKSRDKLLNIETYKN